MVGRLQFRQSTSETADTPCIILDNGGMDLLKDIEDIEIVRHKWKINSTGTRYLRMNALAYQRELGFHPPCPLVAVSAIVLTGRTLNLQNY
jgi:hypothetical protein